MGKYGGTWRDSFAVDENSYRLLYVWSVIVHLLTCGVVLRPFMFLIVMDFDRWWTVADAIAVRLWFSSR